MFVRLAALPLALQLIAADGVPKLDVTPSCRGAAEAGYVASTPEMLKSCLGKEQSARDQLDKTWSSFPAADRASCVSSIKGFEPTYTELATCLEMKRDLAKIGSGKTSTMAASPRRQLPSTTGMGSTAGER